MHLIGQSGFLQALGWAIVNSLWQLACAWLLFQTICLLYPSMRPAQKSKLATVFLFAGFAWFIFSLIFLLAGHPVADTGISPGLGAIENSVAFNGWLYYILPLTSLVYLIILLLPVCNFIRNYRYVRAIRRDGLSKADVSWKLFVQQTAKLLGVKRKVQLWVSEFVKSPVTIGYFKPIILLPLTAVTHLSTSQLEAVLLHELSHIKRADYFINLFIKFIQTILYFNPFVRSLVRTIEREREKSCDDMVMQFQYDPYGYASALLTLEKENAVQSLAVAMAGQRNDLLHRVEWIMGVRQRRNFSAFRIIGILGGIACFIGLNLMLLLDETAKPLRVSSPPLFAFAQTSTPELASNGEIENPAAFLTINNHLPVPQHPVPASTPALSSDRTAMLELKKAAELAQQANQEQAVSGTGKINDPVFQQVALRESMQKALTNLQEQEVKQAVAATKKVVEQTQWNEVETKVADALNSAEKEELRAAYQQQIDQLNWKKLEQNIAASYDQINWPAINIQLNTSLAGFKMDSLQKVYDVAMANLAQVQEQLEQNHISSIPDTDISLQTIAQQRKQIALSIKKLSMVRNRKIVHL